MLIFFSRRAQISNTPSREGNFFTTLFPPSRPEIERFLVESVRLNSDASRLYASRFAAARSTPCFSRSIRVFKYRCVVVRLAWPAISINS